MGSEPPHQPLSARAGCVALWVHHAQRLLCTAHQRDIRRLNAEGMVSSITTMIMVVICQVINSNMAYRLSRPVGLECSWTSDGLLGYYLEVELGCWATNTNL